MREVHVPKTLNINENFRFESIDQQPVHKVLIPKNLLQSTRYKDEINKAYNS